MSDLSSWCLRHYEVLHDFAGPVATAIAAGVAVFVTWKLGSRQAQIATQQARTAELQAETAKQQADAAKYRLRYDLFEKRYVIYQTTRDILDIVIRDAFSKDLDLKDLAAKLRIVDEARFLFRSQICDFLGRVRHDVEHTALLHQRHIVNTGTPDAQRTQAGDELEEARLRLEVIRRTLPASFEAAMNLTQLSDEPPSAPATHHAPILSGAKSVPQL